jgi:hypothetical protein
MVFKILKKTIDFSSLNIPESKNCWFQFFTKAQNQRTVGFRYFKNLKKTNKFHEKFDDSLLIL